MRGSVENLLINAKFRWQGGARLLMDELENWGRRRGRTLFMGLRLGALLMSVCWHTSQVFDVETGSPTERVFETKFGFIEVSKIPSYTVSPRGATFFYKQLQQCGLDFREARRSVLGPNSWRSNDIGVPSVLVAALGA